MQKGHGLCSTGCTGCDAEVDALTKFIDLGVPLPPGIPLPGHKVSEEHMDEMEEPAADMGVPQELVLDGNLMA